MKQTSEPKTVLALMAHPDDAEILCGGTLILLAEAGWKVHIATAAPGDCGTAVLGPDEIARIRRKEAQAAAALLGGEYHCLEGRDLLIFYNETLLRRATAIIRRTRPDLVITLSPQDYMPDHEQISLLARAACFNASVPNAPAGPIPDAQGRISELSGGEPPFDRIPHLYYSDPVEGKDIFGRPILPSFCVDVSDRVDRKVDLLACHASQRDWLRKQHGIDEYIEAMKQWGAARGALIGASHAEGFRQHLGHSFPQDDLLGKILGTRIRRPGP